MSFISVFDVLGPNMIGPSSSHTAGAAAIALLAGKMPNAAIKKADFILYGSFARTYKGHGTDRALLGGIMGFSTDDRRIPDSFSGKTTWSAPTRFRIFSIISSFAFAITFGTPSSFADITHMMLESKLSAIATTTASMFEIPVSLSASISQTSRLMAQVTLLSLIHI